MNKSLASATFQSGRTKPSRATCSRTAAEAFWFHCYLELACKIQVDIPASGEETVLPSDTAIEAINKKFDIEETGYGVNRSGLRARFCDTLLKTLHVVVEKLQEVRVVKR